MSHDELGRVRDDLTVIRRAMGLHPSFGRGVLTFNLLLAAGAGCAAGFALLVEQDRVQVALLAAVLLVVLAGLFVWSRRPVTPSLEVREQVAASAGLYGVVWVAACGCVMASDVGPARAASLDAVGLGMLLVFAAVLARAALGSRDHHYCAGLAAAAVLAGMLLPALDRRYGFAVAHGAMAVGCLTAAAIQRAQLRDAAVTHAAD